MLDRALPTDLILQVATGLPLPSLWLFFRTCRAFALTSQAASVWRSILIRDFGDSENPAVRAQVAACTTPTAPAPDPAFAQRRLYRIALGTELATQCQEATANCEALSEQEKALYNERRYVENNIRQKMKERELHLSTIKFLKEEQLRRQHAKAVAAAALSSSGSGTHWLPTSVHRGLQKEPCLGHGAGLLAGGSSPITKLTSLHDGLMGEAERDVQGTNRQLADLKDRLKAVRIRRGHVQGELSGIDTLTARLTSWRKRIDACDKGTARLTAS